MSVEVFSWNVRDGFSREDDARKIIEHTKLIQPTVAIFPEAYTEGETDFLDDIQDDFTRAGYIVTHGPYQDTDNRLDRHGLLSIVHKDAADTMKPGQLISLGNRNAIMQQLTDTDSGEEITFFGGHFNDRTNEKRDVEGKALLTYVDLEKPTIIAGDLNNTHKEPSPGLAITLGRTISYLVDRKLFPVKEPESIDDRFSLGKIGSLGQRLDGMSSGQLIKLFTDAGFIDADPSHLPTMPSKRPFAQLDHIMHTGNLQSEHFEVLPHNRVSDHRGITSVLGARAIQ